MPQAAPAAVTRIKKPPDGAAFVFPRLRFAEGCRVVALANSGSSRLGSAMPGRARIAYKLWHVATIFFRRLPGAIASQAEKRGVSRDVYAERLAGGEKAISFDVETRKEWLSQSTSVAVPSRCAIAVFIGIPPHRDGGVRCHAGSRAAKRWQRPRRLLLMRPRGRAFPGGPDGLRKSAAPQ